MGAFRTSGRTRATPTRRRASQSSGASLWRMPLERRVYALTYDEVEALRRLQEGAEAPGVDDPAWSYLVELGLVWLDTATSSVRLGLTSAGRGYATD